MLFQTIDGFLFRTHHFNKSDRDKIDQNTLSLPGFQVGEFTKPVKRDFVLILKIVKNKAFGGIKGDQRTLGLRLSLPNF